MKRGSSRDYRRYIDHFEGLLFDPYEYDNVCVQLNTFVCGCFAELRHQVEVKC